MKSDLSPKLQWLKLLIAAFAAGLMLASGALAGETTVRPQYSAPVLFNRGNALLREGKSGAAILAFERAQQITPRDLAVAASLQAARDKAGLGTARTPAWWESAARVLTLNEWAWSGSLALAIVCLATSVCGLLPPRLRKPGKFLTAACALAVLVSATVLWLRWPEFSRAVVVDSGVAALVAPAQSAGPAFALAEGEIVTAKKAHRNFVLVRTADGRSGWVEGTQIERIIPAPVPDGAG